MKKSTHVILSLIVAASLSACVRVPAIINMVRVAKPEIADVKKLAIVSVYANSDVYNVNGRGQMISIRDSAKIVDRALDAFTAEFGKVKGWVVVPPQAMIESAEYKAFAENFTANQPKPVDTSPGFRITWGSTQADEGPFSAPRGMITASVLDKHSSPKYAQQFGKLCSDLNVDAVAVIRLDMAYAPYTAFAGSGTATASVAADVKVINRSGKFVAMTSDIVKGAGRRMRSDQKTGLVFGLLVYNDLVDEMLLDAISKNAAFYAGEINKQL